MQLTVSWINKNGVIMKSFMIVSNPIKDADLRTAHAVREKILAIDGSIKVDISGLDDNYIDRLDGMDCIIVLGGDGTMLRVSEHTNDIDIPLIGINMGTIGFLAEVEMGNVEQALKALIEDKFKTEERMRICGEVYKNGECVKKADALNDVVLSRNGDLQVIGYRVSVNGLHLTDYHADGVILSTPTGSTGYNMSAGGSIVEPGASLLVLTPVCPHTMAARSVLLSAEDEVEVMVMRSTGDRHLQAGAYFDGGKSVLLDESDKVIIKKSDRTTKLIRLSEKSFIEVLQKKMNETNTLQTAPGEDR